MNTMRLVGLLLVSAGLTTAVAGAQSVPTRPPMRQPNAAFALRIAYRAIGMAEARGAGGKYLDAARAHYRSALGKATTAAAAASHEAGAAAALARAALDERPLPAPRDLPSPPALPSPGPVAGGFGHRGSGGRFDPERVARDAALENTPEASDLAKAAVDADIAGERAVFSGNRDDGMRAHRLASDLAAAVRQLASADHPQSFPAQRRRPMGFRPPGGPLRGVQIHEQDTLRPAQRPG